MGGLLPAPKPAPAAPPPSTPTPAAAPAAPDADSAARLRAVERTRRGVAGTIATSPLGVLEPPPGASARKTLLGE